MPQARTAPARAAPARYDRVTIALHWLVAVGIIGVGLGEWLREPLFARGSAPRVFLGAIHQPLGLVVFALILLRIVWRLGHKAPALPANMAGWEVALAKLAHLALYAAMIAVPMVGIAAQFARNRGIDFGIFQIPVPSGFAGTSKETASSIKGVHEFLGQAILLLAFAHAAAAIWHHHVRKDDVLTRMLPERS